MSEEEVANLKTHLSLIKQMKQENADDEFYKLMLKAKDTFGEQSHHMAYFCYEYANFILSKIQKNIDIFNQAAVPNNQHQEDDELQEIAQNFDQSEDQDSGAKSENNILVHHNNPQNEGNAQKEVNLPIDNLNEPTITEDDKNEKSQQKQQNSQKAEQQQIVEEQDEKEICYYNLESALNVYLELQNKMKNGESIQLSESDLLDAIARVRSRLGDLFMFSEEYEKAVDEYRSVINQQEQRSGADCKRALAEIHYLIGNSFLYDNKEGCEKIALREYIKAVNILINHLSLVQNYDISIFQIPSQDQHKVDRFAYLPKPQDSQEVVEIKDVITCLLDKIEDTYDQIGVRTKFQEQKRKIQQQKEKQVFKQVSKDTKVVHLGTFGNRKKAPAVQSQLQQNNQNIQNSSEAQIFAKTTSNSSQIKAQPQTLEKHSI